MAKAANVTKYDAGGGGDNVISDGYIKTVEKVWMDSYAFTSAIPSGTTLEIAQIEKNKKITGIDLIFPSLSTGAAGTGTTISIGIETAAGVTSSTLFLNAGEASTGVKTLSLNEVDGFQYVTTSSLNTIYCTFGRIATTTTAGTIKSIVKYT